MAIEQRIGRIDRIGQTREVFYLQSGDRRAPSRTPCCVSSTRRSTCSSWWSARSARSFAEVDEQQEFSTLVLDAWLLRTEQTRADAFAKLENPIVDRAARLRRGVKQLDEEHCSGNEFDAA